MSARSIFQKAAFRRTIGVLFVMPALLFINACQEQVKVEHSIEIQASQQAVYDFVSDLNNEDQWNPWRGADDTMQITTSENSQGEGASYSWTSEDSGEGTATITKAQSPSRVEMHIDFGDQGGGDSYMQIDPLENGSQVTWGFVTEVPFFMTGMIEDEVGAKYTEGLQNLKKVLEQ